MQPRRFKHLRLGPSPSARLGNRLFPALFWVTMAAYLLIGAGLFYPPTRRVDWPQGLLLMLAVTVSCMGMARQLPAQNVLGAAVIAAAVGGGAHALGSLTGVPFGPYVYSQDMGRPLFGALPWAIPFVWVLFLFSSRGTARLILRPWRRTRNYGFQLIGVTCALVVLMAIGLDVFATQVFSYWKWSETKLHIDLLGAPLVNFVAWGLVSLLILAFATPILINKKPGTSPPADFYPLLMWLATVGLFIAGAFSRHLSKPAVAVIVPTVVAAGLALFGGKAQVR